MKQDFVSFLPATLFSAYCSFSQHLYRIDAPRRFLFDTFSGFFCSFSIPARCGASL